MFRSRLGVTALIGAAALVLFGSPAFADNVVNDVESGGSRTITAGGSTSVSYWIVANNGDGENGCNATGASPATVAINAPAGVTPTPGSLTFTSCGTGAAQSVSFTSNTAGGYEITVSVSDSGPGAYNVKPATFTLTVNAATPSDTTPPTINCTVPDQSIWYADNVSVPCTANDASGLQNPADANFSLATSVAAGDETSSASTGSKQVCDTKGNCATAGPYTFKVDRKGPSVACAASPTFLLNQSPAQVSATVTDGGSGAAASPVSASADTSAVGPGSSSVTGKDNVDNATTVSCSFSVHYGFVGFTSPVDNGTVMNVAKAGQAIPLKWRLVDANGVPVTNLAGVKVTVQSLSCSSGTTIDQVEEYAAGSSGLQNLGDGYYQFNWKTPTSYANSCKTMTLDLGDGNTSHTAKFQFKK